MEDGPETSGYGGKETCQSPITLTDQDRNNEGLNRDNNNKDGEKTQIWEIFQTKN